MQRVLVIDYLVGVEVKPALAALRGRARIPGDAEGLQSAARQGQQVLLQRVHAEYVGHLEFRGLAVLAVGVDEKFFTPAEEACRHATVGVLGVVEIAQHGIVRGQLHRKVVVGTLPQGVFLCVAVGAAVGTGKPVDRTREP